MQKKYKLNNQPFQFPKIGDILLELSLILE